MASKISKFSKEQRRLQKYYQQKTTPNEVTYRDSFGNPEVRKQKYSFIDKLFIRIFLSSILLLTVFGIDKIYLKKDQKPLLETSLTTNLNFLKMAELFNGLFGTFIPIDNDITVYQSQVYDRVEYDSNFNTVYNYTFEGVNVLTSGVVTKISKNADKTYNVTIKGSDDFDYIYYNLESIDYSIYNYVQANDILGKARYNESSNSYTFGLQIYHEGVYYDFYEQAED